MKQIDFVIPVYNEELVLDQLFKVLQGLALKLEAKYTPHFIFINDGSKDKSLEKLAEFHNQYPEIITIINFSRNFGHQLAITAGLDFSTGDCAIVMDADLQDPPEVCLELIKKWEDGYEVVYAQRKTRQDGFFKKYSAYLFYRLLDQLSEISIPKDTGDFRLMDKKVVETIKQFREHNRFMRGLVSFVGFKQTAVLFDRKDRFAGKTHYPLTKMIALSLNGITGFSIEPLKIILQLGIIGTALSIFGIIYTLAFRLLYPQYSVSGWAAIMLSVLFVGSIQMIMMGIIGIYVGRIYQETQHRPLYIVSSVLGQKKEND